MTVEFDTVSIAIYPRIPYGRFMVIHANSKRGGAHAYVLEVTIHDWGGRIAQIGLLFFQQGPDEWPTLLEICQDLVNIRKSRIMLKDKRNNMFFIGTGTMVRFTVVTCRFIDSAPDLLINITFAVPSAY